MPSSLARCSRGELVAVALVSFAVLALSFTELSDGDLGFHLATGREVLRTGRIPQTNVLSYTNPNHPWQLHYWLPGVLFEWVWRAWGVAGLQALKMVVVLAIWLVVYAGARVAGATPAAAALGTLLGASAAAFRFQLRPYLFTHLALAGVVTCCAAYLRATRTAKVQTARGALLLAALIPMLASHLHAGVIDSWLVFLALIAAILLEPFRARLARAEPVVPHALDNALPLIGALAASVTLSALSLALYHPIGARILLLPFEMGADGYLAQHVVEFRMPTALDWFGLAPYWLLVGLFLASLAIHWRSFHSFWAILGCGFLLMSLKHVRLAFGFAVAVSPLLSFSLAPMLDNARPRIRTFALVGVLLASLVHRYQLALPGAALAARTFPPYLFHYLEQHRLKGPDYVSDAWAAPLLGRSYPQHKAFFDNRFEAYPRSFFVDVYQRIRYGQPGWDKLLDRYGVELVLMRYTSEGEARLQGYRPNIRQLLARDARWALVTFDDQGVLFVRRAGANAQHARDFSLPNVDPDRMAFLDSPRLSADALRREIARGNQSTRLRLLAAQAELDAGNQVQAQNLMRSVRDPEAGALLSRMQRNLRR